MSLTHAVVRIDHHTAQILHIDADTVEAKTIRAHEHYTRQHGSSVRTEHEFFGEVCDALAATKEILVVAAHMAQADFRHYVDKHRPALSPQIVGWETAEHSSEAQLVALARKYFKKVDRMAGVTTSI